MGKNNHTKNLNMKVAGTLGDYLSSKVNTVTGELVEKKKEEDVVS